MDALSVHDAIAKTAVLLDHGDNKFFHTFGLNQTQYRVLQLLDLQPGQRLVDLATALLCERSTITRIIDRLEQAGLVQRQADVEDRRSQRVVLTLEGFEIREKVQLLYKESSFHRLNVLSDKEQLQLLKLLEKLQESLSADLTDSGHN